MMKSPVATQFCERLCIPPICRDAFCSQQVDGRLTAGSLLSTEQKLFLFFQVEVKHWMQHVESLSISLDNALAAIS